MPGFSNPFYSSNKPEIPPPPSESRPSRPAGFKYNSYASSGGAGGGSSEPPSYAASTGAPAQYKSLKDLTKGQQRPVPPPPPGRPAAPTHAGYGQSPYDGQSQAQGYGGGGGGAGGSGSARYGDGRNMPPAPSNYGRGIPDQPPRRNVADGRTDSPTLNQQQQPQSGISSYIPAGAQGYANTASSYANAGVSRARDGLDSVFTQQNRDKVVGGMTSAAATGAKLLGKGAWQLGKFAANGGKS